MKRAATLVLAILLTLTALPSFAKEKEYTRCNYTLEITENAVVLQNEEDRNIVPTEKALKKNKLKEGESPTTGLPYDTSLRYQPMMIQISNPTGKIKIKGNWTEVKAAGVGIRAPWGGQYADLVYEAILYRYGVTRLTFLYSDSFEEDEPTSVGPVRSARLGHARLREEWGAGIVFFGGPQADDNNVKKYFKKLGATDKGVVFDLTDNNKATKPFYNRSNKVAAPENVNVDVVGIRTLIPEDNNAKVRPFLFSDTCKYNDGYDLVYSINLDWGHATYISHLYYDESENLYLRYSGNYPYMTWASEDTIGDEDLAEQMAFSNVIIQRCEYKYVGGSELQPNMQNVGQGNADIFIGGRYIPGYWIRKSMTQPTIYQDRKSVV